MDKEVKHQGLFASHDLAKITDWENTDSSFSLILMLMQMLEKNTFFDVSLVPVALCKYVIQVVCIH